MIIKNSLFTEDYNIFEFITSIESESKYTLIDLGERKDVIMKKRNDNNYSCIIKHISPQSKILQFTYEDIIIENSKATFKINKMNHTNTLLQITNYEGICSADCTINGFSSKEKQKLPQQSIIAEYHEYDPTLFSPDKSCIENNQTINRQPFVKNCVELRIDEYSILMYHIITEDRRRFLAFRTTDNIPYAKFTQITYSARLALGLLSGYFVNDNCWHVSFDICNQEIQNYTYKNTGKSIYNRHPLLDYSNYETLNVNDSFKLNPSVFNKFVVLLCENESYQRATLMLINAPNNYGITKGSIAAVALETITNEICNKSSQNESLIEDEHISKDFKTDLLSVLEKYKEKIDEKSYEKIKGRICKVNELTNAQKLLFPFKNLGIPLDSNEESTVKCRDKILHGVIPSQKRIDKEIDHEDFVDYISYKLIMLTSILLLRKAGFSGKIIDWGLTLKCKRYAQNNNINISEHDFCHRDI